jgi:hypothetical protein
MSSARSPSISTWVSACRTFEGTNGPPDPNRQRIEVYLYSHDLAALRAQLVAAGIDAGPIEDGSPGPREQMRVTDPDGYLLMIAQID